MTGDTSAAAAARAPGNSYIDSLTGLRGIAAVAVLFYHCWGVTSRPIGFSIGSTAFDLTPLFASGWMGVDLFFVLSAFLLGYQALAKGNAAYTAPYLATYLRRRILRVMPAFYAQFLVILLLVSLGVYGRFSTDNAFFHLLMAQNFCESTCPPIVFVWWSLPVEFDFYLVLPLLILPLVFGMRWWTYAMLALVAGLAIEYLILARLPFDYRGHIHQLPARLTEFGGGLAAAMLWHTCGERLKPHGDRLFLGGIVVLAAWHFIVRDRLPVVAGFENHWLTYLLRPALTLGFSLVILGASADGRLARNALANPAVYGLGVISYSLYLWHTIPLYWLRDHNLFTSWGLGEKFLHLQVFSYTVPAALLLASLSYFAIERPFLRAKVQRSDLTAHTWSARAPGIAWLIAMALVCLAWTFALELYKGPLPATR